MHAKISTFIADVTEVIPVAATGQFFRYPGDCVAALAAVFFSCSAGLRTATGDAVVPFVRGMVTALARGPACLVTGGGTGILS